MLKTASESQLQDIRGTIFYVSEAPSQLPPSHEPEQSRPLTVAVVEDQRTLIPLVEAYVDSAGHDATSFENGEKLLAFLDSPEGNGFKPDVLITDFGLGDTGGKLNGVEVIGIMKERFPGIYACLFSGDTQLAQQKSSPEDWAKVDAVLSKPPKFANFKEMLDKAREQRTA